MKRELKDLAVTNGCHVILKIARAIPMKRELKAIG